MALKIETFNAGAGSSLFKALSHPLVAPLGQKLFADLAATGPIALYDPLNMAATVNEFYPLAPLTIDAFYVQNVERIGDMIAGKSADPITSLQDSTAKTLFIFAFDSQRLADQIKHYMPEGMVIRSLDEMRLPDRLMTIPKNYLDSLNFATNFAFFRDQDGQHTQIVTANYWASYSGRVDGFLWLRLFDASGTEIVSWEQKLPPANGTLIIDSAEVRARFNLGEFTGQLFIHVVGAAGHDVVKYALDTYGDKPEFLSCTHDANAWPADFYAGLPAPANDEDVILWVQNSHPIPIPQGSVALDIMGRDEPVFLPCELPAFSSYALKVKDLLADAAWPQQIEFHAGKHVVRPRYEVFNKSTNRLRIAHPNVERTDLKSDPTLPKLGNLLGKGYILPAPILRMDDFKTEILPTPMARSQKHLPLKALIYATDGRLLHETMLGNLPRNHTTAIDLDGLPKKVRAVLDQQGGHAELVYDFSAGDEADGWLHGLFRYTHRKTGHAAETSFGSHIFNMALTYKGEPQSYHGKPPGLSTRLFLRLGHADFDTFCCLVYPISTQWHATSDTFLILCNDEGKEVAKRQIKIPASGSLHWRYRQVFDESEQAKAGKNSYILIRDTTCRLFGYHGLIREGIAFSLDHMFGF